jgi:hypothetical protein
MVRTQLVKLVLEKRGGEEAAVGVAEEYLAAKPDDAMLLNNYARLLYEHECRDSMGKAEEWSRRAAELWPDDGEVQVTLAAILCAVGKGGEAAEQIGVWLEEPGVVDKCVKEAIEMVAGLAGAGYEREALEMLRESASAELLEPLLVGLRLYLGEDVKAAAEILEVGKDVAKRIEKRRAEIQGKGAGQRTEDR